MAQDVPLNYSEWEDPLSPSEWENLLVKATAYARRSLRSDSRIDADDIALDAVAQFFLALKGGRVKKASGRSYVLKSVHRQLIQRRHQYRRLDTLPDTEVPYVDEPDAAQREDVESLTAAISALSDSERSVIEAWMNGATMGQTAELLSISPLVVRKRKQSALESLRNSLTHFVNANPLPWSSQDDESTIPEADEFQDVELYIDSGEATKEEVRAVLRAVNDLHVAAGGLGLEYHIDGLFVIVRQEVPV